MTEAAIDSKVDGLTWKRAQATSGLIFLAFVALHLLNTWLLAHSYAAYDTFQRPLQRIYQNPLIETIVLGALGVHMLTALRQRRLRRRIARHLPSTPRQRWHRYAGAFLLLVIVGHVAAVRGPSWFLDIYPRAMGVGFTFAFAPALFYPYYFVFALAALYHGVNGLSIAWHRLFSIRPDFPLAPLVSAGGFLTMAALAGAGGWIYPVGDVMHGPFAELVQSIVHRLTG